MLVFEELRVKTNWVTEFWTKNNVGLVPKNLGSRQMLSPKEILGPKKGGGGLSENQL